MSKITKLSITGILLALVLSFAFSIAPVRAAENTFNLEVNHLINGRSLGLDKELPVDVYVNGGYAFTFEFQDAISAQLPAGTYYIEVKLAGTSTTVMTLGPAEIPAGVDVTINAQLGANKTPTLRVIID
jgi:hypothetical protein